MSSNTEQQPYVALLDYNIYTYPFKFIQPSSVSIQFNWVAAARVLSRFQDGKFEDVSSEKVNYYHRAASSLKIMN